MSFDMMMLLLRFCLNWSHSFKNFTSIISFLVKNALFSLISELLLLKKIDII